MSFIHFAVTDGNHSKRHYPLPILFLLFVLSLSLSSCGGSRIKATMTLEERLQVAQQLFEKKNYFEAKNQYRIITLSYSGSNLADQAQFYIGECHFGLKEYILAASEYERLLKIYPNSQWVDDAKYKLGLCYFQLSPKSSLDQEYTLKAIREFQEFLEEFRTSPLVPTVEEKLRQCREKLAQKVYAAAEQYYKLGYFDAAVIYFNTVLDKHYDSKYGPMAQFYLGESLRRMGKAVDAREAYQRMLDKYASHDLATRARQRLQRLPAQDTAPESK